MSRRFPGFRKCLRLQNLELRDVPAIMVTNIADAGPGSLRQAIIDANGTPGADTIEFAIGTGVQTISLLSQLDEITDSLTINGATQPGFSGTPLIEIDGSGAGMGANGLRIKASDVTIKSLAINKFNNDGIEVYGTISNIVLSGNYVGVDLTGKVSKNNNSSGIALFNNGGVPTNVTIGGATAADRNIIASNGGQGIYLGGLSNVKVQNNYIGVDVTGLVDFGNGGSGILVDTGSDSVMILDNVLSGNGGDGVAMNSATNCTVSNNLLGVGSDGKTAVGNSFSGAAMFGSAAGNTISNNTCSGNGTGIYVGNANTQLNIISGNLIGTDSTGLLPVPNTFRGLWFNGSKNNQAIGNVICATTGGNADGITIDQASGTGNVLTSNFVGVGKDGKTAMPNEGSGIILFGGATGNQIGGTGVGQSNVIAGNKANGVSFFDAGTSTNQVFNNFIGLDGFGNPLGNGGAGIFIGNNAGLITVGGVNPGEPNRIGSNKGAGVAVEATSVGNVVRFNRISDNGGLGVDLNNDGAVNANDTLDPDPGANNLLNFPVITSATAGVTSSAAGTYNGLANSNFDLDFYASSSADASGNGEGARFLGTVNIMTDALGNATFNTIGLGLMTPGEVISATASDLLNGTSEFGNSFTTPGGAAPAKLGSISVNGGGVQRSMVTSLVVTFDSKVSFVGAPANAFTLTNQKTMAAVTLSGALNGAGTAVTLTFTAGSVDLAGSLADGRYTLSILANQFSGPGFDGNNNGKADGSPVDDVTEVGAPNTVVNLFRLFGDADGNGTVNTADFNAFRSAFGGSSVAFDFDGLGGVGTLDFNQFRVRFGSSV